jgi:hypothetical protein
VGTLCGKNLDVVLARLDAICETGRDHTKIPVYI